MKTLIFLLFIVFVSSQIIRKGLIYRNACLGGKIEKGECICPNNTALIGYECKPCIGGSIMFGRCRCPKGKYLVGNNCTLTKFAHIDFKYPKNNSKCEGPFCLKDLKWKVGKGVV